MSGLVSVAVLLVLAAQSADMRRVTVTARWSADSLSKAAGPPEEHGTWAERLDATVTLDAPAPVLPGGPFASRPGPRMIGLLPGGSAMPANLHVVSATLTGSVEGRLNVADKGSCDQTAAYQPGDVVAQGGGNLELDALFIYFNGDSLVGLLITARPLPVRTKTTTACGSTQSDEDRTLTAAFGTPLVARADPGTWTARVTRTPTGYTGTARSEWKETLDQAGETHLVRELTFTIEIASRARR